MVIKSDNPKEGNERVERLKKIEEMANERYLLQIRFKDNGDPFFMRTWDINEPYKSFSKCAKDAEQMVDNTVSEARIVDVVTCKTVTLK